MGMAQGEAGLPSLPLFGLAQLLEILAEEGENRDQLITCDIIIVYAR